MKFVDPSSLVVVFAVTNLLPDFLTAFTIVGPFLETSNLPDAAIVGVTSSSINDVWDVAIFIFNLLLLLAKG